MPPKQRTVFKAALDLPWTEWPDLVDDSTFTKLCDALPEQPGFYWELNRVAIAISKRKHNVMLVAKMSDGLPFFLRHLPGTAFCSGAALLLLSETQFAAIKLKLGSCFASRVVSLFIDTVTLDELGISPLAGGFQFAIPPIRTAKKLFVSKS